MGGSGSLAGEIDISPDEGEEGESNKLSVEKIEAQVHKLLGGGRGGGGGGGKVIKGVGV
jgi:hypothetical protein